MHRVVIALLLPCFMLLGDVADARHVLKRSRMADVPRSGVVIHVDVDAPDGGDGSSWATAYNDLNDALDAAQDGDRLWIAEGVYLHRTSGAFNITRNIVLRGGFEGNEQFVSEADPETHRTIIDGDLDPDEGVVQPALYLFGNTVDIFDVKLYGLHITNARIGIGVNDLSLTINQCRFEGVTERAVVVTECDVVVATCTFDQSIERGIVGSRSDITVAACAFSGLTDSGIDLEDCNVTIRDTMFSDCSRTHIALDDCTVDLDNCHVQFGNTPDVDLIAVDVVNGDTFVMRDCTFTGFVPEAGLQRGQGVRVGAPIVDIRGCTFENLGTGKYDEGQAIHAVTSNSFGLDTSLHIEECLVRNCHSGMREPNIGRIGPVFLFTPGEATIRACTFKDNQSSDPGNPVYSPSQVGNSIAGGLYILAVDLRIEDCVFQGNFAKHYGGGMYAEVFQNADFTNCTFVNNRAEISLGGGVRILAYSDADIRFSNCTYSENVSSRGGAFAIHCVGNDHAFIEFDACRFSENIGYFRGGAVDYRDTWQLSYMQLTNCLFAGNSAPGMHPLFPGETDPFGGSGGSIYAEYGNIGVINCTFAQNRAAEGGSVYAGERDSFMLMRNCILWDNESLGEESDVPLLVWDDASNVLQVAHSIVQGGAEPYGIGPVLDADPMFVDPSVGDFQLAFDSPAIDAGDNLALPTQVVFDLVMAPRYFDHPLIADTGTGQSPVIDRGPIDLGAYEYQIECPADFDGNLQVDVADFFALLHEDWCGVCSDGDVDGDGDTDVEDFYALLQNWGPCE